MDDPPLAFEHRLKRLHFRANHRGTKEADLLVGGFVRSQLARLDEHGLAWLEALMHEQDVDILAWAFGKAAPPARFDGPMMQAMQRLDYIPIAR
ncbi:MAG: succinate dehydrogenase assembly factor 2 [Sphingomonadaceae bacterium]|nr:succinate dehydrogenase assembly factor 2 [Sphingomonadaceae bacterium]